MFRACLFILCLLLPTWVSANTILLMGDSLSAGYGLHNLKDSWPSLLQNKLSKNYPNYEVVNNSISGETTSNGLSKLSLVLERYHPNIVILAYGGNDGLRGLSLTAMETNLAQMIELIQKHNANVLLAGVRLPPNYGLKYTQAFQNIYRNLAKKYHLTLVSNMLLNVDDHPELMQTDALHPNKEGQPIILENIWLKLAPLL